MAIKQKPELILIVEDDDLIVRYLTLQLEKLGYGIAASLSSAEEALEKIVELNPDLILMDIVLAGDMDGIEAARQIRQMVDIPLIFLTAYTDRERLDRAFEVSPTAYLYKPLKERELELSIELALLRHRSDRQALTDKQELENLVAERTAELTASHQSMQRVLDEQNLAQSALQHFRSALDYSADSIFLIERASMRFMDVNQTACARLGYSRDEMLKMGPHDIMPYFNRQMLEQRFDEIIRNPSHSGVIETFHKCASGEVFPVDVRLGAFQSEKGAIIVAVARDVSLQHQSEEALHKSSEQFRQITENLEHLLWISDVQTRQLLYVSSAFEKIWGRPLAHLQMRPRMLLADIHPDDRDRITAAMQRIWRDEHSMDEEYRLLRKDGAVRWLWTRTFPIRDEKGLVYRIGAVTEDITARKEDEEKLRFSEEKFRQLFEGAPIGLGLIGQNLLISEANLALCNMLGYSKDELQTKTNADITCPEDLDSSVENVKTLLSGAISHYVAEKRYVRKDGSLVWGKLHATVILGRNGQPMFGLGMIENIDQAKRAEEFRQADDAAQKNALVREIHHRIKNHLQGIVGLLRQQRRDNGACDSMLEGVINKIGTVAMVHGLKGRTLEEGIDLEEMLRAISSAVNDLIPSGFATHINSKLDHPIIINRNESVPLALAVNELLVNARKFGSGPVDIELSGDRDKTTVHIVNPTSEAVQQTGGSGLKLVKALLQTEGMAFSHEYTAGNFSAEIRLTTPVIKI